MRRSRLLTPLLTLGVVLSVAAPALAAWNVTSSAANANANATTLQPPVAAAPSSTATTATVNWTAPVTGAVPTGYTVLRTAPTSATVCTNVAVLTCTDSGLTASTTYTYTVMSLRAAWSSSLLTTNVTTTAGPAPFVATAPGVATAGTSISVTIQAKLTGGANDTTYTGVHALTFAGPGTSNLNFAPTYPANATFNASGFATVTVTLFKVETTAITVSDGAPARDGTSGSIVVSSTAPATKLAFTGASAACPTGAITFPKNTNWVSFVSLADTWGNVKPNGASVVTVASSMNATSDHTLTAGASRTIAASANPGTTAASLIVNLNAGNNKVGTVTSSATGFTPVSCTITGT